MRILIVGAGAVGGYFGARLVQAGADVTFLVRARRKAQLAATGLTIKSPTGDSVIPAPATVSSEDIRAPYDIVVLSCKAYDLEGAITSLAPAMGPNSAVLPLLNGMRHLDRLNERFGAERVLGGLAIVAATLDSEGRIVHLNDSHQLTFGEQDGRPSERVKTLAAIMAKASFVSRASDAILQEMWEKWVFLASLAGATCLMRANVGEIVAVPGGKVFVEGLLEEIRAIAGAAGHAQRDPVYRQAHAILTDPASNLSASMLRDLEKGGPVEADHVIGDLLARGKAAGHVTPLLAVVYAHLKAFETRVARRGV